MSILQLNDASLRGWYASGSKDARIVTFTRLQSKEGVKLGDIGVSTMCSGLFKAIDTITEATLRNTFILKKFKGSFPVEVAYVGRNADTYFMSLDHDTLLEESPLTVLGICTYTSVFATLQEGDATTSPRTYPDYTSMKVRAASPVPVHVHVVKNFSKPKEVVHLLSQNEYAQLAKSMKLKAVKPNIKSQRTLSKLGNSQKGVEQKKTSLPLITVSAVELYDTNEQELLQTSVDSAVEFLRR